MRLYSLAACLGGLSAALAVGAGPACIEIDPEYVEREKDSENGEAGGESDASGDDDDSAVSDDSDAGDGDGDTGNAGSDTGDSDTDTDTDDTDDTSTDEPGESTGSSTDDMPFEPGRRILVQNQSSEFTVPAGYAVDLYIDHAAMVQAGASATGDDLYVLHLADGVTTTITRVLDESSEWDTPTTRLWFALQESLLQDENSLDSYWLAIDPAATEPALDDPDDVFVFHDAFDVAEHWDSQVSSPGGGTHVGGGTASVESHADGGPQAHARLTNYDLSFTDGTEIEARARVTNPAVDFRCGFANVITFVSASDGLDRAAFGVFESSHSFGTDANDNGIIVYTAPGEATADANWHRYTLRWLGNRVSLGRDNSIELIHPTPSHFPTVDHAPLGIQLGIEVPNAPGCPGPTEIRVEYDWVRARPVLDPPPEARLE